MAPSHLALDALTFGAWLSRQGLDDGHLRWYLDYCCRDDYGAGLATVSAWAGLHYFASRHGFSPPELSGDHSEAAGPGGVLTWPEGNGWLARQLAEPLGERLAAGRVVSRIAAGKSGVEVEAFNVTANAVERWQADHCIIALPAFIAARVVRDLPARISKMAAGTIYAPWLVANIHIAEPLHDRPGAPPSWDNVIYGTRGLGYVDAMHQSLRPTPGATVLTWYQTLGGVPGGRTHLMDKPWVYWRDTVLAELAVPHPDLRAKATRMDVTRYGHAMATPVPGTLARRVPPAALSTGRLHFAHADWAGYSIFEEAFTLGHLAGSQAG